MNRTPIKLALDLSEPSFCKPGHPDEQAGRVLRLTRENGPILNAYLKLNYGISKAATRVFEFAEKGFNVIRTPVGKQFCHRRIRIGLVAYSIGIQEWVPPRGRAS